MIQMNHDCPLFNLMYLFWKYHCSVQVLAPKQIKLIYTGKWGILSSLIKKKKKQEKLKQFLTHQCQRKYIISINFLKKVFKIKNDSWSQG